MKRILPFLAAASLQLSTLHAAAMVGAQSADSDQEAWLMFLQSLASRRTARMCERGLPDYARSFGELYGKWSLQHNDRIVRGEAVFRQLLKAENPTTGIDRSMLSYIEKTMAELAAPPRDTGPLELSDLDRTLCAEILTDLETGLKP
jgi:hypothetical protein